jgi:acetoin utilization protein AcuB
MLVHNRMSSKVISVDPQHTIAEARALLERHHIRHLPVLRERRLAGIITDRDLRSAPATAQTVGEVMTTKPVTIGPQASVDEAARLLRAHKIGAVPVMDGNKLVGILSAADVLDAFVDLSGVGEATYRIVLSGAKGKQAQQQVRQVIQAGRGELKWMHPDTRQPSKLHLRLKANRIDDIVTGLEAAGFDVNALVAPSAGRQT